MTQPVGRRRDRAARSSRRPIVGTTGIYVIALVASYIVIVSPTFGESGLVNRLAGADSLAFAMALAILPALWLPAESNRPSDLGLWIVFVLAYVPSIVIPPFVLGTGWGLLPLWLGIAISFGTMSYIVSRLELRIPRHATTTCTYGWLLVALAIAGLATMIWRFGLPDGLPTLDQVYETRSGFRDQLAHAGSVGAYAVWWSGQIVAPLLVAFGLWIRRPILTAAGLLLFAYVYALTGFRSMLFEAVLLLALIVLVVRFARWTGVAAPATATFLIAVGAAAAAVGWFAPISLLVRRLLVVPGQVVAYYFDFFSTRPQFGLSHSILAPFVPRPYPETPAALIGKHYFLAPDISANGNLWADGMANFGIVGILAASAILGLVLLALDAAARETPPQISGAVGSAGIWSVTNSGLLTSIMTHGIGPLIALVWLMPRPRPAVVNQPARVVHLSTVHRSDDPRILLKECRTLAASGYDVVLIGRGAPPADAGPVTFVSIGEARGRAGRMAVQPIRALRAALRLRADLYHVHDPELLPIALILKLTGAHVLYDAHEDLPRQIAYKAYLPSSLRGPIGMAAAGIEQIAIRLLDSVVAATPRIARRFPSDRVVIVQNFPLRTEFDDVPSVPYADRPERVAYVGRLTEVIGALVMADAARLVNGRRPVPFTLAGPVDDDLARQIQTRAADAAVELPGWLERAQVVALLASVRVGLVLFQRTENYVEAYPTKLFEYMASGIPVVASDFPLWREIVGEAGCGLLVDPADPQAVARAITTLLDDPVAAAEMGRRGRAAVDERYSWDAEGDRLVRRYRTILDDEVRADVAAPHRSPA